LLDPSAGRFGGIVEPNEGFWALATGNDAQIIFTETLTTPNRNPDQGSQTPVIDLLATTDDGELEGYVTIGFTENFDPDNPGADYMFPISNRFLSLFTKHEDQPYLLQYVDSEMEGARSIPVGFYTSEGGRAQLSWSFRGEIPDYWNVQLRDNKTGEVYDLQNEGSFNFELSDGMNRLPVVDALLEQARTSGIEQEMLATEILQLTQGQKMSFGGKARFELVLDREVSTDILPDNELPGELALKQNYPNPFNPTTNINFELPETGQVRLSVYNMLGQQVATLVNSSMQAGRHTAVFDGSRLSSGMYIYRLEVNGTALTRKMMLVK
ncbi:MAG: T9SS type A sorting domain-containing protein, partial [Balneolales bacterium]|nr:T9SS type A sorting domain-containing protein [Balneolales bacterium]